MGAVLVVLGAADLWDAARTRPIGWTKAGLGIVFLITGPSIVLIPDVAFKTLTFLLAVLITIRGGTVLVGAVALSIFTARIVATWAPPAVPISSNSQVISPVSPRLLDMMIAVVAGAAGAYATVDKPVSSSITGVALVPPLAVVGVTLQVGDYADAAGAFVLFLTNLVSIILAASLVFVLTGFALIARLRENQERMKTVIVTVFLGALIVIVPLAYTSEGILTSASRQSSAQDITEEWLADEDQLRINQVVVNGDEVDVVVTGQGDLPPVSTRNDDLSDAFGVPTVATIEYFPSLQITEESQP